MILAIDLGTTYSLVGYFDEEIKLVKNEYDSYLTPSVVGFENGKIVVGERAKQLLASKSAVELFKRNMGKRTSYFLKNEKYSPELLSSYVLKKLIDDANREIDEEIEGLIISVPAYFNEAQRYATKLAGQMLGYEVLRIVNEPTAAALYAHFLVDAEVEESNYIILDLGGGTFDITVVEYFDKIFEIKAIAGNTNLGSHDYTQKLVDIYLNEYPNMNVRTVYENCEYAKKLFNSNNTVEIEVDNCKMTVMKEEYIKACIPLNDNIRDAVIKAVKDSNITMSEIDKIIFVGGGAKSIIFREFIYHMFNSDSDNEVFFLDEESDLYVAKGLAFFSAMLNEEHDLYDYILTDVCPFSLGTKTTDRKTKNQYYDVLINRNTILPYSVTRLFSPVDKWQETVKFDIYQGEHYDVSKNDLLHELNIKVTPGQDDSIQVKLFYDINSLLQIKVKNMNTDEEITEYIHHSNELDDVEFTRLQKQLSKIQLSSKEDKSTYYIEKLKFIFENCEVDRRDYYGEVLMQYDLILDSGSKIDKIKFEKELLKIIADFESSYDRIM